MMETKKLKKIMTDLAAGHINKKKADELLKPKSKKKKSNSK